MLPLLEKQTFHLPCSRGGWVGARQSSVCANESEPHNVNGPVVVKLTTIRFTGTVSTQNRSFLAAYLRPQYVPPWDSVPHTENYTFSVLTTSSLREFLRHPCQKSHPNSPQRQTEGCANEGDLHHYIYKFLQTSKLP